MRLFILASCLLFTAWTSAAERIERHSIPVNPDVRFSLNAHRATTRITTGNIDSIEMVVTIRHNNEDILDRVDVNLNASPSFVRAAVDYDEPGFRVSFGFIGFNDYQYPDIHFQITLPEQASLQYTGHRSRLDIEAPTGRIEVNSHRGSGRLTQVRNDLELDTHRGNFEIEVTELHDIDIDTHRGDINLDIFGAEDFTLVGETHRGDVRFIGKNIPVNEHDREQSVNYVEGSGSNFIDIQAHRGDIRIDFRE
ncbi:MAG: DUF4097 family beta strand repeat-containing protein [Pseudohongiellaceae bacterium]